MRRFMAYLTVALLLTLCGCSKDYDGPCQRGIYYWSTTFDLDSAKIDFINRHGIERLYVRYFDVVPDDKAEPVPNATIEFGETPRPAGLKAEIIPVVYLLNDCFAPQAKTDEAQLAENLLNRVLKMSATHSLGEVKEIQIDCDWTGSTRERFFKFLNELKSRASARNISISATIRLHQLSQPVPPVDKGILMVYNTGDMTDINDTKPILDTRVVKKYISYLKDYKLPMGAAYPIYKWDLLFRNGKFVDIQHYEGELPTLPGDQLVTREPTATEILEAQQLVESVRPDCRRETILFDLNNYNINRYSHEEFESFFN